eukprot:m.107112 g.107112  ORF g.107112 m.107112 type:complete len:51 (+) comp15173_c5_seq6:954-1106(+)
MNTLWENSPSSGLENSSEEDQVSGKEDHRSGAGVSCTSDKKEKEMCTGVV